MTNTALSAKAEQIAQTVTFRNEKHKRFFLTYLPKCRYGDVYHAALVYCLGIDEDTRKNVNSIYDFKTGCVKTECLHEGWITSGSAKIIRMAYNLYNNGTPSVYDYEDAEEQLNECRQYTVEDLFCWNQNSLWRKYRRRYNRWWKWRKCDTTEFL